jgi:hypothetical protein
MSFELHSEAIPGSWKIQAITRGQVQNYTFYVDYYQLPLAKVTITLPEYITYKEPKLVLKIDCFYTFGKPVKGNVNVLITKISECGELKNVAPYSIEYEINGQLNKTIDLSDTRLLNINCAEMRFNVTAIVNDSLTESIYYNFEAFDVYKHELRAEQLTKKTRFKPGKQIRQQVQVKTVTGKIIEKDVIDKIKCEASYITQGDKNTKVPSPPINVVKVNPEIVCDFGTSDKTYEFYTIIKYEETVLLSSTFPSFNQCNNAFIQVILQEPLKKLNVGETINLLISSNEPIEQFIYYVVIRGSIVNASSVTLKNAIDPGQPFSFEFLLKREMVPEVIFAVFFPSPTTGVIVSDAISLKVTGLFHNEVKFNVTTPNIDAGQEATIFINAEPDSQLFVLGVDEAVLALKQGNDIIEKRVLRELQSSKFGPNSATGFLQSGMSFASNAIPECKESSYYEMKTLKGDDDSENKNSDSSSVRKDFRETWIWDRTSM